MTRISRRKALSALGAISGVTGAIGGTTLLTGCGEATSPRSAAAADPSASTDQVCPVAKAPPNPAVPSTPCWDYVRLDPAEVAERTYLIYPEGGCMYAVVGGVIGALADKVGEPFRSFPIEMMRYGDGGVGAWGSLCGVANGAAALIGMFHHEKPKEERESLITELGVWYETTPLPKYEPAVPLWADEVEPSVGGSLLCHVSVARWCETSSCEAFCKEKKERCRRLAADGASQVVKLLNSRLDEDFEPGKLTPEVQSCVDCHGKKNLGNAMVKMNCATCHQFEKKHP